MSSLFAFALAALPGALRAETILLHDGTPWNVTNNATHESHGITITLPAGTWTNFTLTTEWTPTDATSYSHMARWELVNITTPAPAYPFNYVNPVRRIESTSLADSGAFADNRATTLTWEGIFDTPVTSDGSTQVLFTPFQRQPGNANHATFSSAAQWANTTLTLDNTPLTSTAFSGQITADDGIYSANYRAWKDPQNPDPGWAAPDTENPDTWSLHKGIRDKRYDLIPFYVTADGYYNVTVLTEVAAEGNSNFQFRPQAALLSESYLFNDTFDPWNVGDGVSYYHTNPAVLDWDDTFYRLAELGVNEHHHSGIVEAWLEAGQQYYFFFGQHRDDSDINFDYPESMWLYEYEGTIRGLNGTAIMGTIPEPSTAALLAGAGALALALFRRRFRKTPAR